MIQNEAGTMQWCINSLHLMVPSLFCVKNSGNAKKSPQQMMWIRISSER